MCTILKPQKKKCSFCHQKNHAISTCPTILSYGKSYDGDTLAKFMSGIRNYKVIDSSLAFKIVSKMDWANVQHLKVHLIYSKNMDSGIRPTTTNLIACV